MKILILANYDLGLYQFRKDLIFELLKNHEVIIALPYGDLVEPLKEAGCTFIDTPMDRRGINPRSDLILLRQYRDIINQVKPDLTITYTIKPNVYGGIACRAKHVPYATNITGLGTAFENNGLLRKIATLLYRTGLKSAKVVFFENSDNCRLFVDEKIVHLAQTYVLNGAGVNLEQFSFLEYPQNEQFHFLFIGRVMREKGIDQIFTAMEKLVSEGEHCFLDVVGPFEEDYQQMLKDAEKKGWLAYHGYQKDVRPFIKACDCFVLPSWHEGMANTNLECAASGRPVITTNIPGCQEAVIEGKSGLLCKPKDIDSLYNAMKIMIGRSREERMRMGLTGRKHMEDSFDKKKVVALTIEQILK